jgi:hypothetical protein
MRNAPIAVNLLMCAGMIRKQCYGRIERWAQSRSLKLQNPKATQAPTLRRGGTGILGRCRTEQIEANSMIAPSLTQTT